MGFFITLAVLTIVIGYSIVIYNNLVSLKHGVSQAWANIDVLLKQRHDELPKLVTTCKQYMAHESDTLTRVMQTRSAVSSALQQGDIAELGVAESALRLGMTQLFAVAEAYPDLKANDNFQHLQARISGLENAIADRREYYNEAVNNHNVRIEQFPDVFIARRFGLGPATLLEFQADALQDVDMNALFG